MPTDSVWHEMMVARAKELALNPDLTVNQIMERTGLSQYWYVRRLVSRVRKAAKDGQRL